MGWIQGDLKSFSRTVTPRNLLEISCIEGGSVLEDFGDCRSDFTDKAPGGEYTEEVSGEASNG